MEQNDLFARLEAMRKPVAVRQRLTLVFCVCGFAAAFLAVLSRMFPLFFVGFGLVIAGVVNTFASAKKTREYNNFYKNEFVRGMLARRIDNLVFEPENGISEQTVRDTRMMSLGNRYRSDDYVSGSYKGVRLEFSDVKIEDESTDSDGHSHTTVYFSGRWMIFDFNKAFSCALQVREKGFAYAKKTGGLFSSEDRMEKIELESEEFNRRFDVYAVSEHEGFYILTPQFMQAVSDLADITKGKMLLCFTGSKLHIAVNSGRNAFEPPVLKPIDPVQMRREITGELDGVIAFIDRLRLDRNIYKGE
ncbi:MAG: DUF3137 domain-containing protein [Clostridiales bacterium]|nr:DUF3137 domain-containing protein [Clostridiales bacterium]